MLDFTASIPPLAWLLILIPIGIVVVWFLAAARGVRADLDDRDGPRS